MSLKIGSLGSPPRGRGRLTPPGCRPAGRGLTPAWAGTAQRKGHDTIIDRAHPRVGGDGFRPDETDLYAKGSPPRGRGRLAELSGCRPGSGLTPAWAGTAPRFGPRFPGLRAHPRVGGDGSSMAVRSERCRGSPPRGRGRRWADHFYPDRGGLTPAWAGTAAIGHRVCPFLGAHPRVGGDGGDPKAGIGARQGSPPRGRGRPRRASDPPRGLGLTPAWAGTATRRAAGSVRLRAHPRVGGDGCPRDGWLRPWPGSPPRGRGRRPVTGPRRPRPGLTPAWAGTAKAGVVTYKVGGAHPRVGGDGALADLQAAVDEGSPPRGRGRQRRCPGMGDQRGLTPAWAGTAPIGGVWRLGEQGSPPRGRGRPGCPLGRRGLRGLTPAWAGTANGGHDPRPITGAHPRVGGDGLSPPASTRGWWGSPPRGRGRLVPAPQCRPGDGLTPAWAGTASRAT